MRCAAPAISSSVANSTAPKVPAITTNCTTRLRAGSMNCGRKAAKNSSPFGLVSADSSPWRNSAQPLTRGSAAAKAASAIGGERHTCTPSHTR